MELISFALSQKSAKITAPPLQVISTPLYLPPPGKIPEINSEYQ